VQTPVLIGGDSAGGNLALGLLSHLTYPHPLIPHIKATTADLAGLLLLSPWVTFNQHANSMTTNAEKDCLDIRALKKWSDQFMTTSAADFYNQPKNANAAWWREAKVEQIAIVAGGDEVFVDDIVDFAEILKVGSDHRCYILFPLMSGTRDRSTSLSQRCKSTLEGHMMPLSSTTYLTLKLERGKDSLASGFWQGVPSEE